MLNKQVQKFPKMEQNMNNLNCCFNWVIKMVLQDILIQTSVPKIHCVRSAQESIEEVLKPQTS